VGIIQKLQTLTKADFITSVDLIGKKRRNGQYGGRDGRSAETSEG